MPSVLVIGGANGAGKSTIAPALIANILGEAEFVNADVIARGLAGPRYAEVEFEAGRLFLRRLRTLAAERKDFAFESTLASRTFARFLRELRDEGYMVHLAFVWVGSARMSARRVAKRAHEGGHDVDRVTIQRRFRRTVQNFVHLYMPLADEWRVLDNRPEHHFDLIAEGGSNITTRLYDALSWTKIRREAALDGKPND